jgi:hypothetical protein
LKNKKNTSNDKIIEFKVSNNLSLRLYEDSRPYNYEIGKIQKGLVLLNKGKEIIGEGAGFGVPVAKYRDKTFFPGSAKIYTTDEKNFVKIFKLNTVSLKHFKTVLLPDSIYHKLHRVFTELYLNYKNFRQIFDLIMKLRRFIGVTTQFTKTQSRGIVKTEYEIQKNGTINVVMSFYCNTENLEELIILNEQGADWFYTYKDSDGLILKGREIGAWDIINADSAKLECKSLMTYFSTNKAMNSKFIRGWEKIDGSLSWAGLNFITPYTPRFEYTISFGSTFQNQDNPI